MSYEASYKSGVPHGQFAAQDYINWLDPMWDKRKLPIANEKMGIEEFFEAYDRYMNFKKYNTMLGSGFSKGVWDGYVLTIMLFRRFGVRKLGELEQEMVKHMKEYKDDYGCS